MGPLLPQHLVLQDRLLRVLELVGGQRTLEQIDALARKSCRVRPWVLREACLEIAPFLLGTNECTACGRRCKAASRDEGEEMRWEVMR